MTLLTIQHLSKQYEKNGSFAVSDASFTLASGETLGIVGESGSGKTTLGKMIAGMIPPSAGEILFNDRKIDFKDKRTRQSIQYIFQDPYGSLNPSMQVHQLISEPLQVFRKLSKQQQQVQVMELLDNVGLESSVYHQYPIELSGGMRQRVGIARAIASDPLLLVCDEPTSALDVTIQSQILELFRQIKEKKQISYLFIAHSLEVIYQISDQVIVMKDGQIREKGSKSDIFFHPADPYTKALIGAIPQLDIPIYQ